MKKKIFLGIAFGCVSLSLQAKTVDSVFISNNSDFTISFSGSSASDYLCFHKVLPHQSAELSTQDLKMICDNGEKECSISIYSNLFCKSMGDESTNTRVEYDVAFDPVKGIGKIYSLYNFKLNVTAFGGDRLIISNLIK